MKNVIEAYINRLTINDVYKFADKNNLNYTNKEIEFVYEFIKGNYKTYLNNPKSFDLSLYKNNFSNENYNFINGLINKYSKFIK